MKKLLKPICFLIIGIIIFAFPVRRMFVVNDFRIYQTIHGFQEEKKETLDAVYIGTSKVYAFWQPPVGWNDFGITVYSYAVPNMPAKAIKYIVEDARKTQPDALYIINLPTFYVTDITEDRLHYMVDYMPLSQNKLAMLKTLLDEMGATGLSRMEYYYPPIRFHSRWEELTSSSFRRVSNGIKGASHYTKFLGFTKKKEETGIDEEFAETEEEVVTIDKEKQKETLLDFMEYCEEEQVKILFMIPPLSESEAQLIDGLCEIVTERGFDLLDLSGKSDEIGLQPHADYYDESHTNVHGSLKATYYLGKYLKDQYGFEDKRGQKEYTDWDLARDKYYGEISQYCLDVELENGARNYKIKAPALNGAKYVDDQITVSWNRSKKAHGYQVYRKTTISGDKAWRMIADIPDTEEKSYSLIDKEILGSGDYIYTVLPYQDTDQGRIYGSFIAKGVQVSIILTEEE